MSGDQKPSTQDQPEETKPPVTNSALLGAVVRVRSGWRRIVSPLLRFFYVPDLGSIRGLLSLVATAIGLSFGLLVTTQIVTKQPTVSATRDIALTCVDSQRLIRTASEQASLGAMHDVPLATTLAPVLKAVAAQATEEDDDVDHQAEFPAFHICWVFGPKAAELPLLPSVRQDISDDEVKRQLAEGVFFPPPRLAGANFPLAWLGQLHDSSPGRAFNWPGGPALFVVRGTLEDAVGSLDPKIAGPANWGLFRSRRTLNLVSFHNASDEKPVRFRFRLDGTRVRSVGGELSAVEAWGSVEGERELLPGRSTWTLLETRGGALDVASIDLIYDRTPLPDRRMVVWSLTAAFVIMFATVLLNIAARRATWLKLG